MSHKEAISILSGAIAGMMQCASKSRTAEKRRLELIRKVSELSVSVNLLKGAELQNTKVATPQAGADGINPSQLSDNGPAHQIDVLPLAGTPSDNTSQPEMAIRGCTWCRYSGGGHEKCITCDKGYSNFSLV